MGPTRPSRPRHARAASASVAALLALAAALATGCSGAATTKTVTVTAAAPPTAGTTGTGDAASLPRGDDEVTFDPDDFTTDIDNPYWPMKVGSRWEYRETDGEGGEQKVVVTVTSETKVVDGVTVRVVHDEVTADGEKVEVTDDWYAQDRDGNVWYFGEDTAEYEDGEAVSTEGSWESGVDGAQAGVIVPASPVPGLEYREEHYRTHAEDAARVLAVDGQVEVPFGQFDEVLMTYNFTPLEPKLIEHKFYVKGLGPVLALTVSGGADREELTSFNRG